MKLSTPGASTACTGCQAQCAERRASRSNAADGSGKPGSFSSGQGAPASTQAAMAAMRSSGSLPVGGIGVFASPRNALSSRLLAESCGTIAGPESPPRSNPALLSSRSPANRFAGPPPRGRRNTSRPAPAARASFEVLEVDLGAARAGPAANPQPTKTHAAMRCAITLSILYAAARNADFAVQHARRSATAAPVQRYNSKERRPQRQTLVPKSAGVAELADALDSKSSGISLPCGFDPHLQHHLRFRRPCRGTRADILPRLY